jgi:uncharacterized protein YukE
MSDNLFEGVTNPVKTEDQTPESFELVHYVGEDKKYKTEQDFVKSKYFSDQHINKLEGENQGLREELARLQNTGEKLDTLLDQIAKQSNTNNASSNEVQQTPPESGLNNESSEINPSKIEELVEQKFQERNQQSIEANNLNRVTQELTQRWGDDAQRKVQEVASQLGKSVQDMQNIAKTEPTLFLALMKENPVSQGASAPSTPETVIDSSKVVTDGTKGYSYYEKLRKENPQLYFTPKVQEEMFKATQEMGDKFLNS